MQPDSEPKLTGTDTDTGGGNLEGCDGPNAESFALAMTALGIELRLNLRSLKGEQSTFDLDAGEWSVWEEYDSHWKEALRARIASKFAYPLHGNPANMRRLWFPAERWINAIRTFEHGRRVDPFVEWLKALPEWDGTRRLDELLCDRLRADCGELSHWASRYIVLGAVYRALEPGCKCDELPILIGPQDGGKSTLLSVLVPWEKLFSDSLVLSAPDKERIEALQGVAIVEIAELVGMRKADVESLKAFLSRRDDGHTRLAYRQDPVSMPRRCVLIATTNTADCLPNDTSGLRRFVPIPCKGETPGDPVQEAINADRDQLWAEGLNMYYEGVEFRLPRELKPKAAEVAELHRHGDDVMEDEIARNIETLSLRGHTLREVAGLLESCDADKLDRRMEGRIAEALKASGFEKKRQRIHGTPTWLWMVSE